MASPRKITPRTIQRMVTRLQAALAVVYADEGRHEAQRTNEHGTLTVTWQSGRSIRAEGVSRVDTGVPIVIKKIPPKYEGARALLAEHEG